MHVLVVCSRHLHYQSAYVHKSWRIFEVYMVVGKEGMYASAAVVEGS